MRYIILSSSVDILVYVKMIEKLERCKNYLLPSINRPCIFSSLFWWRRDNLEDETSIKIVQFSMLLDSVDNWNHVLGYELENRINPFYIIFISQVIWNGKIGWRVSLQNDQLVYLKCCLNSGCTMEFLILYSISSQIC